MNSLLSDDVFFCDEILKRLSPDKINMLMTASSTLTKKIVPFLPEMKRHIREVNENVTTNDFFLGVNSSITCQNVILNDGIFYSKEVRKTNDKVSVCLYRNNKRHGPSRFYSNGKLKHLITFKDNLKHGIEIIYDITNDEEKILTQKMYKNDLLHGKAIFYNKTLGYRDEIEYINGMRDGRYERISNDNLLLKDGNYYKNKKDGIFNKWSPEGRIVKSSNYTNGRLDTFF